MSDEIQVQHSDLLRVVTFMDQYDIPDGFVLGTVVRNHGEGTAFSLDSEGTVTIMKEEENV